MQVEEKEDVPSWTLDASFHIIDHLINIKPREYVQQKAMMSHSDAMSKQSVTRSSRASRGQHPHRVRFSSGIYKPRVDHVNMSKMLSEKCPKLLNRIVIHLKLKLDKDRHKDMLINDIYATISKKWLVMAYLLCNGDRAEDAHRLLLHHNKIWKYILFEIEHLKSVYFI